MKKIKGFFELRAFGVCSLSGRNVEDTLIIDKVILYLYFFCGSGFAYDRHLSIPGLFYQIEKLF